MNLKEGKYIVRARVHWVDGHNHEFILSTLSSNPISIEQINKKDYPAYLEKVLMDAAIESNRHFRFSNDCFFASGWSGPYMWIYGINKGENIWSLDIIFEKMVNLKMMKKYRENKEEKNQNFIKMKLSPQEKNLVIVKRLTSEDVSLKWKFEQVWEEIPQPE